MAIGCIATVIMLGIVTIIAVMLTIKAAHGQPLGPLDSPTPTPTAQVIIDPWIEELTPRAFISVVTK